MIGELSGQIGNYVADLIGTDIKMHGSTLSNGMTQTIGTLYQAERVVDGAAPSKGAENTFDNLLKAKPPTQSFKR